MNDPTTSATPDAPTTRRYLLGRLPEQERDRLEARLLSDGEAYKQVLAAESELIDQYVDGELPAADRRAFEERLLGVERIRERVTFARSLRALAAAEAAAAPARSEDRAGLGERLAALVGLRGLSPSPAFAAATAAIVVLLVGVSGWLGWRAADLADRVGSLQARTAVAESALERARRAETVAAAGEAPATEPAVAGPSDDGEAAAPDGAELARERERAERLAERVAELEGRPEPRPRITAAFVLSLATRSTSGVREIAIPDDADTVRFQLDAAGETGAPLRARLLAAGGRVAWSDDGLTASEGSPVVVELPAERLEPGRYELLVEQTPPDGGGSGGGEPELIGAYEFRVR